jgi:hypothetical protein
MAKAAAAQRRMRGRTEADERGFTGIPEGPNAGSDLAGVEEGAFNGVK